MDNYDENELKKEVAKSLLSIGAVFIRPREPFTWASGIRSPIYCDNRLTLTAPNVRTLIENGMAQAVRKYYPEAGLLMGTSTAGIAHAAITAHIMDLPMGYVRGSKKDHGRTNRIEGKLTEGEKTVVFEDLISTGGSAIDTVEALRAAGADVLGVVSIFTYGMKKADDAFSARDVECHTLSDLDTLADIAVETGHIEEYEKEAVLQFRDDPLDESWIHAL